MTVEETMKLFGVDRVTAEFIVGMEKGRISGDVFPPMPSSKKKEVKKEQKSPKGKQD